MEDDVDEEEELTEEDLAAIEEEDSAEAMAVACGEGGNVDCGDDVEEAMDVESVVEGACEVRSAASVEEAVWKCPSCNEDWSDLRDEDWMGCDDCPRNWHSACMPKAMKRDAKASLRKTEPHWRCWVCTAYFKHIYGEVVPCMKCREVSSGPLDEWLVCARIECRLRVHRSCAGAFHGDWMCGIC